MIAWETMHAIPDQPPFILNFAAIWQAAERIVFSTTLDKPFTVKTRIERKFDPEVIMYMKEKLEQTFSLVVLI